MYVSFLFLFVFAAERSTRTDALRVVDVRPNAAASSMFGPPPMNGLQPPGTTPSDEQWLGADSDVSVLLVCSSLADIGGVAVADILSP